MGNRHRRNCLSDQTQEARFIRKLFKTFEIAENVSILYGGSVKPENAKIF
jgi:triosephosphate isomerase